MVSTRRMWGGAFVMGLVTICISTLEGGTEKNMCGFREGQLDEHKVHPRGWSFNTSMCTVARACHKQKVKKLFLLEFHETSLGPRLQGVAKGDCGVGPCPRFYVVSNGLAH